VRTYHMINVNVTTSNTQPSDLHLNVVPYSGIGGAHGVTHWRTPKTVGKTRTDLHNELTELEVAPNRPGETWEDHVDSAAGIGGGAGRGAMANFFVSLGRELGRTPKVPTEAAYHARVATAVASLHDTVKCAVVSKNASVQRALLEELAADLTQWEIVRVESTLADPAATVKRCVVHLTFTPFSASATPAMAGGASRQSFAEMTSSPAFAAAVARVQQRSDLDAVTMEAACELLRAPEISALPITLAVEIELFLQCCFDASRAVDVIRTVLQVRDPTALSVSCARHRNTESEMGCTAQMQRHRVAVGALMRRGVGGLAAAQWDIVGAPVSSRVADLSAVLKQSSWIPRLLQTDLHTSALHPAVPSIN
jgi:hypothetical protein